MAFKLGQDVLYRLPDFPAGTPAKPAKPATKDKPAEPEVPAVPGVERLRPAKVVHVWNDTCANLQVFLDQPNDLQKGRPLSPCDEHGSATSVTEGKGEGQARPNRLYVQA